MATTNYRDPECTISEPGHLCAGRGGKEITADNGVACFKNAEQASRPTLDDKLNDAADRVIAEFTTRSDADQAAREADARLRSTLEATLPFMRPPFLARQLRVLLAEADRAALLAEYARSDVPA